MLLKSAVVDSFEREQDAVNSVKLEFIQQVSRHFLDVRPAVFHFWEDL
jgi:hypothetical protein